MPRKSVRDDMSKDKTTPLNRRAFFGMAATGAATTALGVGSATPVMAQSTNDRTKSVYKKTAHIETYYQSNRYYGRGKK